MATIADFREAVSQWMKENLLHPDTGNFFQSRITRTPGMVTPMSGVSGTYTPTDNPAAVVRSSNINQNLRDVLANEWQDKPNGFIRVNSDNGKILRHEQIHDVFNRGGLANNSFDISPMLDTGVKNYVSGNPLYKFGSFPEQTNEALAYQLSSSPEQQLASKIAVILSSNGKPDQAKQIVRLVGK